MTRLRPLLRHPLSLYSAAGLQCYIAAMVSRWWITNHSLDTALWPSVVVVSLSIVTATMLISAAHGLWNCQHCACSCEGCGRCGAGRPFSKRMEARPPMARKITALDLHKRHREADREAR